MYLFFKICVQQIQTSRRIAVDPAIVVIVAQSYAALPKFVLDKRVRQQIVLRGLELPWRYNRYLQTGAFSLACQLGVEPASRQKTTQSPETKQTLLLKALFNRGFFLAPNGCI